MYTTVLSYHESIVHYAVKVDSIFILLNLVILE